MRDCEFNKNTHIFTIENYPPKHDHIWQKTMDLKVERSDNCRVTGIIQKLVCPYCGEEKWEEVK